MNKVLVLKKIVTIILCLLCAVSASALSYASPYKGAGRNGYIYTTSSVHMHCGSAGLAQAPTASLSSVNHSSGSVRGIHYGGGSEASVPTVQVMRTSASHVSGGVTSNETYSNIYSHRRNSPDIPDNPGWTCGCVDEDGDEICDRCGCDLRLVDEHGHCDCYQDSGYCWCPVELDWRAMFFMVALAGAYALYKVRAGKKETI